MQIRHREAREEDFSDIVSIIYHGQRGWPQREKEEEIRSRVFSQRAEKTFLLAEREGIPIATAFYFPELRSFQPRQEADSKDAHLGGFYLLPTYWGSGEASRFLSFVLGRIREDGFSHVRLWSPAFSRRAGMFYHKEGWKQSGRSVDWQEIERVEYLKTL